MHRRSSVFLAALIICLVILGNFNPPVTLQWGAEYNDIDLPKPLSRNLLQYSSNGTDIKQTTCVHDGRGRAPISSNSSPSEIVSRELAFLREGLATGMDPSNFTKTGLRISSFADLFQAIKMDEALNHLEAMDVLTQYFPWWHTLASNFRPWSVKSADLDPSDVFVQERATGYVMCVNEDNLDQALDTLSVLRHVLEPTVGIEVAYAGQQALSERTRQFIKDTFPDVELTDLADHFDESSSIQEQTITSLGAFAVLSSRFTRVILVEPGIIFFSSPELYFEDNPSLIETGLLYFHERTVVDLSGSRWVSSFFEGTSPRLEFQKSLFWTENLERNQDASVVFVDKSWPSAWMSVLFTAYLNLPGIRNQNIHLKKLVPSETFWLASELASTPYSFVPYYQGLVGTLSPSSTSKLCGRQTLHPGPNGKPLWFKSGLRTRPAQRNEEFQVEDVKRQTPAVPPESATQFHTFTHWFRGAGMDMADQPSWGPGNDDEICIDQDGSVEKLPHVTKGYLHNLIAQAQDNDERTRAWRVIL